MVLDVAGPTLVRVEPSQEGEDAEENPVEELGLENRVVNQLVDAVAEKYPAHPMEEKQQDHQWPRQATSGKTGGSAG